MVGSLEPPTPLGAFAQSRKASLISKEHLLLQAQHSLSGPAGELQKAVLHVVVPACRCVEAVSGKGGSVALANAGPSGGRWLITVSESGERRAVGVALLLLFGSVGCLQVPSL